MRPQGSPQQLQKRRQLAIALLKADQIPAASTDRETPTVTATPTATATESATATPSVPPNSFELIGAALARGEITINQAATDKVYRLYPK